MSDDVKKIIISLIFGCSLALTVLTVLRSFAFPYDNLAVVIACWVSIVVVNFRNRLFK